MERPRLVLILFIISLVLGLVGWYYSGQSPTVQPTPTPTPLSELHEPLFISARLIRIESDKLVILGIPQEVKTESGTYVNYMEMRGKLNPTARAYRLQAGQYVPVPLAELKVPSEVFVDGEIDATHPDEIVIYGIYSNE